MRGGWLLDSALASVNVVFSMVMVAHPRLSSTMSLAKAVVGIRLTTITSARSRDSILFLILISSLLFLQGLAP